MARVQTAQWYVMLPVLLLLAVPANAKLPLQDATATVEQLFSYQIDPKDFPGQEIQVKQNGQAELPSWLEFDKGSNELVGVPTMKDKGTYILTVGEEMFAINVMEPTRSQVAQPSNSNEQIICKPHDPISVVYVKVNGDTDTLSNSHKTRLVRSIGSHLSLKAQHISVSPNTKDLVDTSVALIYRGGDAQATENSPSVLSWVVGCGIVKMEHIKILEKLESSALDGSLSKLLGMPVSGWQVQSNQPKVRSKRRLKRQALVTATMTPTSSTADAGTTTMASTTASVQPTQSVTTEMKTTETATTVPVKTAAPSTEAPSTKAPSTEAATQAVSTPEPTPKNAPPKVNDELVPSSLRAKGGQIFRWTVPEGLFTDPEGGELTYSVESSSNKHQWAVTDEYSDVLEIITLADKSLSSSMEKVTLKATDAAGDSSQLQIPVQHEIYEKKNVLESYTVSVRETPVLSGPMAPLYLALTLSKAGGLNNMLTMRFQRRSERGEITITFGENRGRLLDTCPEEENSEVLTRLRDLVGKGVTIEGSNENLNVIAIDAISQISPCSNRKPQVNAARIAKYEMLKVEVGKLYENTLPVDLFTDYEDVDLSKMKVKLIAGGLKESQGWITLNPNTRTLQALTWNKPDTESQYTLVAMDSDGDRVEAEISVEVIDNTNTDPPTNLFTLTVNEKYSVFANTQSKQVGIYKKLLAIYKNADISIKSVKSGSVVIQYSLTEQGSESLPGECPKAVENYKANVFDGQEIRQSFKDKLSPYKVESVDFVPQGPCEGVIEPASGVVTEKSTAGPSTGEKKPPMAVIIGIVIGILVLIIIIVIVVICVQKRKAKENEKPGQNGSYIEKGIPVVLDEEKRSIDKPENQPLIMTSAEVSYKPTPPAYPKSEEAGDYQPDTPPVSEPDDEQRMIDRSL